MNICVCGYYYRPEFFAMMDHIKDEYHIDVMANKTWPTDDVPQGIDTYERPNIGLEWGAYDHYVRQVWDEKSDVLFLHDDIRFRPVIRDYEVMDPLAIFKTIDRLEYDHVYLFESLDKATKNYFVHGRALKCSERFLKRLMLENNGFPYDEHNTGHVKGPTPKHCKHYNYADYKFAAYCKSISDTHGWEVGSYLVLPALECATRGRFDNELEGPVEDEP